MTWHSWRNTSWSRGHHVRTNHSVWSVVVCLRLSWSSHRPTSGPRGGGHVGHGLLLHPGHGPLPLHSHLQVLRQSLTARQHLVGHDLGPELVQLVLVEGSGAPCSAWSSSWHHRTPRTLGTHTVWLGHSLVRVPVGLHGASPGARDHGTRGRAVGWDRTGGVLRAS